MSELFSSMPRTEVRHLALVIATAENGSLTDAARHLHLTPSALSHQLRGLEDRLGAQLFERRAKRLHLTAAGTLFVESARRLLNDLRAAEVAVEGGQERVEMRLTTECYTCYAWLPAVVKRLQRRFDRLDVRIVVEATRRPIEALLDGELDVAILSSAVRHPHLAVSTLFRDELVVLMSAQHRLAERSRVRAADFCTEHLFTYSIPLQELDVFQRVLSPARVRPLRVTRVELTEALIELVRANLGLAVIARWALPRDMRGLHALSLTPRLDRQWVAAWRKNGAMQEQVGETIAALRETAPAMGHG